MKTLTLFDARQLVEQEPRLVVIETLPEEFYAEFHLPRAECVPLDDEFEASVRQIATDLATPMMVYGMDAKDRAPERAAQRLERMGFAAVCVYPGGKIEWKENGLATD